ncbi:MAG: hypothetical protein O3B31_11590 [Chloroflexi bacterium]|nr:hypothetical protein [Chloroflexota bacterium]MDA1003968.1 hypothetical protein [Chloroflexota bacterium]
MDEQGQRRGRLSARELLRAAFVNDDDPRFPLWLPLPGLVAVVGWAAYQQLTGAGAFLPTALWPGAAIFVLASLATWLGWQLEID